MISVSYHINLVLKLFIYSKYEERILWLELISNFCIYLGKIILRYNSKNIAKILAIIVHCELQHIYLQFCCNN
jgi:hypothetical protein